MAFGRAVGCAWIEAKGRSTVRRWSRAAAASGGRAGGRCARTARRAPVSRQRAAARRDQSRTQHGRARAVRCATLFDRIARVARTDSTILLRGESGTGKELVARAAHRNSPRADRPFVAINCAALTDTLLESELFGHEKGAFTGAIGLKRGKMELAEGGTLFLDEIGELPLTLQAKLLRALQEREFERVGGTRPVRVDFRLIAATNRDLEAAARAGTFRQDLFYRLNVVSLVLPPLRDSAGRTSRSLPTTSCASMRPRRGRPVTAIDPAAMAMLTRHDWPGNVRELENAIEQALALGSSESDHAEDLPACLVAPAVLTPAFVVELSRDGGGDEARSDSASVRGGRPEPRGCGAVAGRASQLSAPPRPKLRSAAWRQRSIARDRIGA